jgi:transposase
LKEQGWKQCKIAEALGVTPSAVSQWLRKGREEGVAGLHHRAAPGATPKLTAAQRQMLPGLLERGATAWGFAGEVWTCARVARMVEREFGVRYHPAHVSRLLHALGWSPQKPARRARQCAKSAITHWQQKRWPALKRGLTERVER